MTLILADNSRVVPRLCIHRRGAAETTLTCPAVSSLCALVAFLCSLVGEHTGVCSLVGGPIRKIAREIEMLQLLSCTYEFIMHEVDNARIPVVQMTCAPGRRDETR